MGYRYTKALKSEIAELKKQLELYDNISFYDEDYKTKLRERDILKWRLKAKKNSLSRTSRHYRTKLD